MRYIDADSLKKALCIGCEKLEICKGECDITHLIDDQKSPERKDVSSLLSLFEKDDDMFKSQDVRHIIKTWLKEV